MKAKKASLGQGRQILDLIEEMGATKDAMDEIFKHGGLLQDFISSGIFFKGTRYHSYGELRLAFGNWILKNHVALILEKVNEMLTVMGKLKLLSLPEIPFTVKQIYQMVLYDARCRKPWKRFPFPLCYIPGGLTRNDLVEAYKNITHIPSLVKDALTISSTEPQFVSLVDHNVTQSGWVLWTPQLLPQNFLECNDPIRHDSAWIYVSGLEYYGKKYGSRWTIGNVMDQLFLLAYCKKFWSDSEIDLPILGQVMGKGKKDIVAIEGACGAGIQIAEPAKNAGVIPICYHN